MGSRDTRDARRENAKTNENKKQSERRQPKQKTARRLTAPRGNPYSSQASLPKTRNPVPSFKGRQSLSRDQGLQRLVTPVALTRKLPTLPKTNEIEDGSNALRQGD